MTYLENRNPVLDALEANATALMGSPFMPPSAADVFSGLMAVIRDQDARIRRLEADMAGLDSRAL